MPLRSPLYSKKERSCPKDHRPSLVLNFLFLLLAVNLMLVKSSMATPLPFCSAERTMDFARVWFTMRAWVLSLPPSRLDNLLQFLLVERLDRKSTRLNSSHVRISYAVFCLK